MGAGDGADYRGSEGLAADGDPGRYNRQVTHYRTVFLDSHILTEVVRSGHKLDFPKAWALATPGFIITRVTVVEGIVGRSSHDSYFGGSYHLASPPNGFARGEVPY